MPTEHPYLLVIDAEPERAARVNNLLRNSGMNVHVLHADNPPEARRLLDEFSPFLVYFVPDAQDRFPISEAARLASEHETFLGVDLSDGGQSLFASAAGTSPTIGIGDEAQLPAITRRLTGNGQAMQAEEHMRSQGEELEHRLETLMSTTQDPIAYLHEGLHVAANPAYLELLGIPSLEALSMVSLLEILEQEGTDLKAMIRGFGRQEFPESGGRFTLRAPGREPVPVRLDFTPVRYDGEDCVQMFVCAEQVAAPVSAGSSVDASPPAEPTPATMDPSGDAAPASATSSASAMNSAPPPIGDGDTDPLTGMLRRTPFMNRLVERLANLPDDERAAVFFLANDDAAGQMDELSARDLDHYVQSTAGEILSCLEADDDVCRFTDSSFAIFALRHDKSGLRRLAEKLCAGIERGAQEHPGDPLPKTCSVGFVLLDNQHHDPEHTLKRARATCQLAAEEGNRVMRYKPARAAGVSEDEETQWRERIRYALDNEDFYTVQHAIMNLDGDLEGLVENRTFMHEDEGDVPAREYLPAAERNQLASQVDRIVIPGLLHAVAGGEERQIIEISGNSLQDFSFATWFQRTLQESRVAGKRIVLQWPAWAARQQTKAARRLIDELGPHGVQFSVSGFDAEPRTLELLSSLKLHFLTLDQGLTRELEHDPQQLDSIREIIRAAEAMQVLTIASDVPTPGDLATLWRAGVKLVSGDFVQETPRVIGQ